MRFRKKRDVIDAIQWTGDNWDEVVEFTNDGLMPQIDDALWLKQGLVISLNWWIIKQDNKFTHCHPDVFDGTYEPVEEMPKEWTVGAHTLVAQFVPPIEFQVDPDGLYCSGCGKPKVLCLHDTSGCS